jgi:hypothetical protein
LKPLLFILIFSTFLALPTMTLAQAGKPAVEYCSLLNIPFAEAEGDFRITQLQIVFPPSSYEQAMLSITKASGEEVASLPLRLQSYLRFPVFGNFGPESNMPDTIKLGTAGDFVLTIKLADEVITRFPFSLVAEPNPDPYAPPKGFFRDGPWRDLAYFSQPANSASGGLRFNWWMSLRELPIGMTNPSVTLHLMQDAREIARSVEEFRLDKEDWQFFASDLVKTKGSNRQLTLNELASRDSIYLLIVKANDVPIKSYRLEVRGGRLQRAEQSRIDFAPHADFISPRFVESTAEVTSADRSVTDAYWVRRSGVRRSFAQTTSVDDQNQRIGKR